jgi:hypothetical protein
LLVACGDGGATVTLKYTTPTSKESGPLYIQVRASADLVDALRRTVTAARGQRGLVFSVAPAARGGKDCTRTIRFPVDRITAPPLRKFAGEQVKLVMFGNHRGGVRGSSEALFCAMPRLMIGFLPPGNEADHGKK